MLDTIFNHKSIRKYLPKDVKQDILRKILEAGTRAPTTGNMQVYSIIVTSDKDLRQKLWEAHFKQDMVLQAPLILTFCADFNRFNHWCNLRKAEPCYDNFLSFFTAAIDALLVAQNVCLAAESYGLGICYLGTATYMADKIVEILSLPKMVVPVATITMGYPDEKPPLTDRLSLEAVVHYETYRDYTKKDIEEIYADKEQMELYKEFVKENGVENLAQVFTQKRYTRSDNEYFSKQFLEVIKNQGFLNLGTWNLVTEFT